MAFAPLTLRLLPSLTVLGGERFYFLRTRIHPDEGVRGD
jgi:hypothetical protein